MKISSMRLCELRKQANYTQRQVADMLGIKQPSYIRYEIGTSEPTQVILCKIADIFGCTVDYLLGRSEY
jgi:transcriptional regulator with XRE-family HTH domain